MPVSRSDVDLLQQAIANSGLSNGNVASSTPSEVVALYNVASSTPSEVVALYESVSASDNVNKDASAVANVSSFHELSSLPSVRPAQVNYVSTMAVHDSVTGIIRRHRVRKVVFCVYSCVYSSCDIAQSINQYIFNTTDNRT